MVLLMTQQAYKRRDQIRVRLHNSSEHIPIPCTNNGNPTATDWHLLEDVSAPITQSMSGTYPSGQPLARLVLAKGIDQVHRLWVTRTEWTSARSDGVGAHDDGALHKGRYD